MSHICRTFSYDFVLFCCVLAVFLYVVQFPCLLLKIQWNCVFIPLFPFYSQRPQQWRRRGATIGPEVPAAPYWWISGSPASRILAIILRGLTFSLRAFVRTFSVSDAIVVLAHYDIVKMELSFISNSTNLIRAGVFLTVWTMLGHLELAPITLCKFCLPWFWDKCYHLAFGCSHMNQFNNWRPPC